MINLIEVKGLHTNAKIFSHIQQDKAVEQVQELCDQPFLHDAKIRIMPDYHAGKGCVIGTTIVLKDKVVPNLVGVDVGCGVHVTKLAPIDIDFQKLDDTIKNTFHQVLIYMIPTVFDTSQTISLKHCNL